jgi:predicted metal-dependent hydrolase
VPRRLMQLEFALDDASVAPGVREGATLRRILLAGGTLWYGFVRARRRTLTIVVERGRVEVRAPRWTTLAQVEAFIREKEPWIRKRVSEARRHPPAFRWRDAELLPLLGKPVQLAINPQAPQTRRVGDRIEVLVERDAAPIVIREAVLKWLLGQARIVFLERLALFAPKLGVPLPELRLSNARTQWGSCNARGRVLLNWRLIHVPPRLLDYVVVHELAHLRELNHSSRFWALVEQAYPDCRSARHELNQIEKQLPTL